MDSPQHHHLPSIQSISAVQRREIVLEISKENQEKGTPIKDLLERAAKKLNVSERALRNLWQSADPTLKDKSHASRLLSCDQDRILVLTAQAFSACNQPLEPGQIRGLALRLWQIPLKKAWVTKWLKKNRTKISLRTCKGLTKKRNRPDELEPDLRQFIADLKIRLDSIHFPAHCVFNVDETRVCFKESGISFRRIEWSERSKHNMITTRQEKGCTLVTFIAANGNVLFSCFIFKVDFNQESTAETEFTIIPGMKSLLFF